MKTRMALLGFVSVLFLAVGSISGYFLLRDTVGRQQAWAARVIRIGDQAPDFSIKDEAGRQVSLSDYRGKLVFLHFWATWCQPCAQEMPLIDSMKKTFKDRKFRVLTVSLDTECNTVKDFEQKYNIGLPLFLDPGRQVSRLYGVYGLPATFLIDGKGVVVRDPIQELQDRA